MNRILAWFAENSVAANMMMVLIIVVGIIMIGQARKEVAPTVAQDYIQVSVSYPGSSPSEIEKNICSKIESAIFGIEGIANLSTYAYSKVCRVSAEVESDFESNVLLEQIKSSVEGISFPEEASKPIIKQLKSKNAAAHLVVSGKASPKMLKKIAETVRGHLLSRGEITQIEFGYKRDYQITIEVSETSLQRYGLSFAEVAQVVQQNSSKVSAGGVESAGIIVAGEAIDDLDYRDMVLRAQPDGGVITVGDVATVIDGFSDGYYSSYFNGEPSEVLDIYRVGNQDIIEVVDSIRDYIANPDIYLPEGISLHIWGDGAKFFSDNIRLLVKNAAIGLILVFITLLLFLRFQLALWVSVGIAVSFLGAFAVLPFFDASISMISVFAFILVLGIVVDDAIIIGENIYTQNDKGIHGLQGAISGVQGIAKPVIFAICTTLIAFLPIAFYPTAAGKFIEAIPVVVFAALIFSLIESLLILPAHLSGLGPVDRDNSTSLLAKIQDSITEFMSDLINNKYKPFLQKALLNRYATLAAFFGVVLVSFSLVFGNWFSFSGFPRMEVGIVMATVDFPEGIEKSKLKDAVDRMEKGIKQVAIDLSEEADVPQIGNIRTSVVAGKSNYARVEVELAEAKDREIDGHEIIRRWRDHVGEIAGSSSTNYIFEFGNPGAALDIALVGNNLDELQRAAENLKKKIAQYPGVYNVSDNLQDGGKEIRLSLLDSARNLGINVNDVATQVRQAFHGVGVQSIRRDDQEVKVVVRFPAEHRQSLWHLENMLIRLPDGSDTPLMAVASIDNELAPASIHRKNMQRVARVSAHVDSKENAVRTIMRDLKPNFLVNLSENYSGVRWGLAGEQKDDSIRNSYQWRSFLLVLIAMYVLMAILFKSYSQPILILTAVPFGAVGALLGHLLVGIEVTSLSFIGVIAVAGIVVNDNFVLMHYINERRQEGMSLVEAITTAGGARFRAILLTTLTTFIGLAPLMFETSIYAQFLIPMAVSISFGVLFATTVTLILVPVSYHIVDDITQLADRVKGWLISQLS